VWILNSVTTLFQIGDCCCFWFGCFVLSGGGECLGEQNVMCVNTDVLIALD